MVALVSCIIASISISSGVTCGVGGIVISLQEMLVVYACVYSWCIGSMTILYLERNRTRNEMHAKIAWLLGSTLQLVWAITFVMLLMQTYGACDDTGVQVMSLILLSVSLVSSIIVTIHRVIVYELCILFTVTIGDETDPSSVEITIHRT